ncbi:MAG: penicillin-binding protein 2 [Bacteroidia bacterium]|nr:penicillin-binding protein 2 [Bacteroidia bacterium]GIV22594.1 MAG: penicillin-binding protein [Bacteroidia bacterium]
MSKTLKRFYLILVLIAGAWIGLTIRLGYLQWKYREASPYVAYEKRPYLKKIVGERGSILARDTTVWATSMPLFRIAVDPAAWTEKEVQDSLKPLAQALSRLFPHYHPRPESLRAYLFQRWKVRDRHVYLFPYRVLLTYSEKKQVEALPLLCSVPGRRALIVEKITHKRSYPYGNLARITLGYLVNDSVAWRGLESAFHEKLRGEERWMLVQRLPNGVEIPLEDLAEYEPQPGGDLFTTLDPHLQDIVDQALQAGVERHKAKGGVAILMEVQTGEILALANYKEMYNDAVSTLWEPGSTFKVATAAALLEEGVVRPNQRFIVPASLKVADRTLSDGHDAAEMTFEEALAYSRNVAFASLCYKAFGRNPYKFYGYLQKFRLLSPTGITLYPEPHPASILPNTRYYNPTTLPWLAIGYNVQLTPLQLLAFYNAIANGGVWVAPRLVREIRYPDGRREPISVPPPQRILSAATAQTLQRLLQAVVTYGTAHGSASPLYPIAGKTGTAKKVKGRTYVNEYRASFVGFFPANKPLYSCIVVVDEPKEGGIHGGEIAAPIFRQIADAVVFRDLRIAPQEVQARPDRLQPSLPVLVQKVAVPLYNELSISTPERPPTPLVRAHSYTHYVVFSPYRVPFPEAVVGMSLRQALYHLESEGYRVFWKGDGPMVVRLHQRSPKEILLELGYEAPS